ncbi:hypothetical protein [Methanobrevibacter sp. DSM 116169]|uniref:hypothetical protein n=1 Tax=Methanobrevibacter sp. DSM 116169 TaxID=3242727 RepID=UPI0038FC1B51
MVSLEEIKQDYDERYGSEHDFDLIKHFEKLITKANIPLRDVEIQIDTHEINIWIDDTWNIWGDLFKELANIPLKCWITSSNGKIHYWANYPTEWHYD